MTKKTLKYHFFSVIFPVIGMKKIGISGAVKSFLARYIAGDWKIHPNSYPNPIIVRGRTSDTKLFFDVIINEDYPVPKDKPEFIVDAGANIGLFSVYYASRLPNVTIFAIEPELSNFVILEKNTAAYPNVKCIRKGLWSELCNLKVLNESSEKWAFEVIPDPSGDIEAISMNEIIQEAASEVKCVLVKMDIEGADQNVLSKNTEWLDRVTNFYIEIHGSWRQLFRSLEPYKYEVTKFRENLLIGIHGRQ